MTVFLLEASSWSGGYSTVKSPFPMLLPTCTMAWHDMQPRPACASGVSICSEMGRSKRPLKNFAHWGAQEECQGSPLRHSVSGLRTMTVSIIENGAGSVDVSARPALPSTVDTSGNCLMMRSCTCINRSEEHTSELQSLRHLVCRLLLEKN